MLGNVTCDINHLQYHAQATSYARNSALSSYRENMSRNTHRFLPLLYVTVSLSCVSIRIDRCVHGCIFSLHRRIYLRAQDPCRIPKNCGLTAARHRRTACASCPSNRGEEPLLVFNVGFALKLIADR